MQYIGEYTISGQGIEFPMCAGVTTEGGQAMCEGDNCTSPQGADGWLAAGVLVFTNLEDGSNMCFPCLLGPGSGFTSIRRL